MLGCATPRPPTSSLDPLLAGSCGLRARVQRVTCRCNQRHAPLTSTPCGAVCVRPRLPPCLRHLAMQPDRRRRIRARRRLRSRQPHLKTVHAMVEATMSMHCFPVVWRGLLAWQPALEGGWWGAHPWQLASPARGPARARAGNHAYCSGGVIDGDGSSPDHCRKLNPSQWAGSSAGRVGSQASGMLAVCRAIRRAQICGSFPRVC